MTMVGASIACRIRTNLELDSIGGDVSTDLSSGLPVRRGHFLLESGHHTNLWLTLDALFVDLSGMAPPIHALADRLRPYDVSAVCGPLLGGAFLAQALATTLGVSFYYTESGRARSAESLFNARYELSPALRERVRGSRVAVVDDAISAGSSVRATVDALGEAGASVAVVAALFVLGDVAEKHFQQRGIPIESLETRELVLWEPRDCPLCREGSPLEDPQSSSRSSARERSPRVLVKEFYSEIWDRRDLSRCSELLTPDFTFRGSLGSTHVGPDAFTSYVDGVHGALGDYHCEILDLVAERDQAFARMRFSGTHRGELLGYPATGKPVEWAGAALFAFRNGRIADLWVLGDVHALLSLLERQAG